MDLTLRSDPVTASPRRTRRPARVFLRALAVAALAAPIAPTLVAQGTPVGGAQAFDRTKAPAVPRAKSLKFPKAQTRTLRNGTTVTVLEDHTSPVVSVTALVDVSPSLEPAGKTGLAGLVQEMLGEGTTTRTADQLADAFAALGNHVSPFGFYTIPANVDRSLELMADQLLHPAFPESALARLKANQIAEVQRARESPDYLAGRVFASVVYGPAHPYSRTPTETGLASITRADVERYYGTYYRPPNVTFVVAGDVTPAQAVEKLNRAFGAWTRGTTGRVDIPTPRGVDSTVVYLYDRPGSPQSVISAGAIGPRRDTPDYFAIQLMNAALGGAFNSRINLNLREQHHYSYGAHGGFAFRRVPEVSTFRSTAAVATPKTDSAVIELMKELRDVRGPRPITAGELAFARRSATASLPLQFETIGQRAGAVAGLVRMNLPLDYYDTVIDKVNAVTLEQARHAAQRYIDPSKLAIVVVGDRKVIEPALRAAGVAPVVVVDKL